jgi:hypothetical protein
MKEITDLVNAVTADNTGVIDVRVSEAKNSMQQQFDSFSSSISALQLSETSNRTTRDTQLTSLISDMSIRVGNIESYASGVNDKTADNTMAIAQINSVKIPTINGNVAAFDQSLAQVKTNVEMLVNGSIGVVKEHTAQINSVTSVANYAE